MQQSNAQSGEPATEDVTQRIPVDADRLRGILSELAGEHRVPGAQLAIHGGGETVAVEVGVLEHGTGRHVTRDAAFPIGSITKSFTATLAMILVADGDLELDAPLADELPELASSDDDLGTQLTLRHLLSHTGGLSVGPDSPEVAGASRRRYVLDHSLSQNLVVPPGTGFSYSNMGFVLTGHLIEVITGMTWWEAVESIVLRPLGIEPSFIVAPDRRASGRPIATGHSVNTLVDKIRPLDQSLALAEAPAGALQMSAIDLVNFGLVLAGRTPGLLPPACAEQMRQAVPRAEPFGLADGWGMGLMLYSTGHTVWVGHDGNADGTACYLRIEPVNGWVVALTSNASSGITMWQELVIELSRAGLSVGNYSWMEALGQPAAPPPGCVGTYVNGDVEFSVTAQETGDLWLAIDGEAVAQLAFHEGLIFAQQDLTSGQRMQAGRFLPDPITGDLDLIQVGGRLARRRTPRAREG